MWFHGTLAQKLPRPGCSPVTWEPSSGASAALAWDSQESLIGLGRFLRKLGIPVPSSRKPQSQQGPRPVVPNRKQEKQTSTGFLPATLPPPVGGTCTQESFMAVMRLSLTLSVPLWAQGRWFHGPCVRAVPPRQLGAGCQVFGGIPHAQQLWIKMF